MNNLKALFKTLLKRNFLSLWCTQYLGSFNDNLFRFGFIAYLTLAVTDMSAVALRNTIFWSMGLFMLPFFVLSSTAGELADKYSKSRLIKILKFTDLILVLLAVSGFYLQNVYFLLFVLFLGGAQSALFGPVKYSVLLEITEEKNLLAANAFMEAGTFVSIIQGTLMGGLLVAALAGGVKYVCVIMAISAALGFGASLFMTDLAPAAPQIKIRKNPLLSAWKSIFSAKRNRVIVLCILGISWFWFLGSILIGQLPPLTQNVLHGPSHMLTFLFVMLSAGLTAGALACQWATKGEVTVKFVPISTILMSLLLIGLAFENLEGSALNFTSVQDFIYSGVGMRLSFYLFAFAFCGGLYIVPLNAMLQLSAGKKTRSRIIAVNNIVNAGFILAATVLSAILLYVGFTIPYILRLVALANLCIAIYICGLLPTHIVRAFGVFVLTSLYKVQVKGLENYKKAGRRAIIIANHTSFLDAALIGFFLPDDLCFAVDSEVAKKWWVKFFLQFVDFFLIDPLNPMAVKSIVELVKKGKKVVIFPEGRISTTGGLMKIYPGPAMIADKANADIIPIYTEGSQYSHFSYFGKRIKTRGEIKITLNIMEPMRLNVDNNLKSKQRRFAATDKVYDLMSYMKYKSSRVNTSLFKSLLYAADFAGANSKAVDDISRKPLSFRMFTAGIFGLADKFKDFTEKGENVGLLLPTSKVCAVAFFGLQATGRVAAMINFTTGIKNVCASVKTAKIKTVITAHQVVEKAELHPMIGALVADGVNIVYLEDLAKTVSKIDKLKAFGKALFAHKAFKAMGGADIKPEDPAAVLFTSGSEGVPKGVVLSHKNILGNAWQISSLADFTPHDSVFNALPMFHSLGLTAGTILPLVNGMSVFFYPTPLHYRIVPELVYDCNSTLIFGTDTFFNGYAKMAHPYDFYSVRYAVAGGEKIKDETFKLWSEKFGVRILEGYGATETSPVIACDTPMHFKRGSVGRPMPGVQTKILTVPGIEHGGELAVKGDNIMLGYYKEDKPGALQPPVDGWYNTGDIVEIDDEGYIFIKGRAKRFAKIGGEMVSLAAVENELSKVWLESKFAVTSVPDPKKGEKLVLFTDCKNADVKTIAEHFRAGGLGEIYIPKTIKLVEELPVMGTGKTDYLKLKEMALEEFADKV